jgi:hypothetical protein
MSDKTPVPNLLPFPLATDAVADGDDILRALVARLDIRLGKWANWTPTVGGLTVQTGQTLSASWIQTSDWVHARISVPIQAISGTATFSLPVAADASYANPLLTSLGRAVGNRTGQRQYFGDVVFTNASTVSVIDPIGGVNPWTGTSPVTWQVGDRWTLNFGYRPGVQN